MRVLCVLAFAVGVLSPHVARAQDVARMEGLLKYWVDVGFMGAVLVAHDDQILLRNGYGHANVEWDAPATPSTRFRIASITKQFTAAAILLLEQGRRLSLEDTVRTHWREAPGAWDGVTIFHLLTHTAGMPEYAIPGGDGRIGPQAPDQLIARFRDRPLDFAPGTRWQYSNSNYAVLGYLIERISGLSYAEFIRQHIFVPLGMNDSGYDSPGMVIPRRAAGYVRTGAGLFNARYADMSAPYAAGGLCSTVDDLLKWTRGLFGGTLLPPAIVQRMITPVKDGYGFGVFVQPDDQGRVHVFHTGGIAGFSSALVYYPASRITVVTLSNIEPGSPGAAGMTLATTLGRLAHGDDVPRPAAR